MTACEIMTHLWLGNIRDSVNKEFINSVDIIINCSKKIPFLNKHKKCIRIPVDDNLEKDEINNMYNYFPKITKIMHSYLSNNKIIFIHCYAGKQRSASIVIAYIMRYLGINLKNSIKLLESKRSIVFTPLVNFKTALVRYESDVLNKKV
jgi:protein-tyrosine phosphatase